MNLLSKDLLFYISSFLENKDYFNFLLISKKFNIKNFNNITINKILKLVNSKSEIQF